jgi:hypothetical protein
MVATPRLFSGQSAGDHQSCGGGQGSIFVVGTIQQWSTRHRIKVVGESHQP